MTGAAPARRRAGVRQALLTAFAVTVMYSPAQRAARLPFPFAGGEWHAIFACPDGHLPAAALAVRVYLGTVCAVAALLIGVRYPIHWAVVAVAAFAVGCVYRWDVFAYPHQRDSFRTTLGLMLLAIAPLCFAVCRAAHLVRTFFRHGVAESRRPSCPCRGTAFARDARQLVSLPEVRP